MSTQHKTISIVRHAERLDQVPGGWREGPRSFDSIITPRGRKQAHLTGEFILKNMPQETIDSIDVIYSSPYARCLQTAGEIAAVLGKPVKAVHALGNCASHSRRSNFIVYYLQHSDMHDIIHYDGDKLAIPVGTVPVEPPITTADSFEDGCRQLADALSPGSHTIIVTHSEGVKDFIGVRHPVEYCGIIDCTYNPETKEFTPIKYSVGHDLL